MMSLLLKEEGSSPPPIWYVTGDELNSVPAYMKQRLTLDKVNGAISDMATYAEANAHLIAAPRKKLAYNNLDKAIGRKESWFIPTKLATNLSIILADTSSRKEDTYLVVCLV